MSRATTSGLTEALAELLQGFEGNRATLFVGKAVDVLLKELTREHDFKDLGSVIPEGREFLQGLDMALFDE